MEKLVGPGRDIDILSPTKNKRELSSGNKGQTEKSHNRKLLNNRYPHTATTKTIMSYFTQDSDVDVNNNSLNNLINLKSSTLDGNKNVSETNIFHTYANLSHQPPSIPTLQNAWRRQNQPHFALTIRQIGSNSSNVNVHSAGKNRGPPNQTWSQKNIAPKAYYWN